MNEREVRRERRTRRVSKRKAARLIRNILLVTIITLIIAGGFRVQAQASDLASAPTTRVYTSIVVQQGDSLWGYACDYCNSKDRRVINAYVEDLKELNHIGSSLCLKAGANIIVYQDVPAI